MVVWNQADADKALAQLLESAQTFAKMQSAGNVAAAMHNASLMAGAAYRLDAAMRDGILPMAWNGSPPGLDAVVMDLMYANDCCVRAVAALPLDQHMQDAEVACKNCRSTFRYVANAGTNSKVWRYRLPAPSTRQPEAIVFLSDAIASIERWEEGNGSGPDSER